MNKYINMKDRIDEIKLKEIGEELRKGKVAIFPTDTVYGIGTNALNEKAVMKLYDIKNRPIEKPISLLVSDIDMIKNVARSISNIEYEIINKFFPGSLTIILKKKAILPNIYNQNLDTVGIRIPNNIIARKIIKYANVPIATSSANISGKESIIKIDKNIKELYEKVDYIIDGGESKDKKASTIVKVIDNVPHILRIGKITKKEIEEKIGIKGLGDGA